MPARLGGFWKNFSARRGLLFFFFQAEDGIRDADVTGVQTCALPICAAARSGACRMAAALAGLSSRITPTRMWRSCTLPASTQGRAASQNLWQYLQLGSVKV